MRQLRISKQITNRETASLDKYLQEVSKFDLVTADEEVILAQKIRQGDTSALERLTKANLRFVISVSKQYQNQGLSLSDLINEGNLGLIKAAKKFDETKGFKFISYAVWWIRQSILQAIAEHARVVRLPLNKIGSISKVNQAYSKLEQSLEREPSLSELAEELDFKVNEVDDSLKNANRSFSVDSPVSNSDESSSSYAEIYLYDEDNRPDRNILDKSLSKEIERCLSKLSERERQVVEFYYGLVGDYPLTLEEIGVKLDLTRERVRQIREKGIKKLKSMSKNNTLKSYLG